MKIYPTSLNRFLPALFLVLITTSMVQAEIELPLSPLNNPVMPGITFDVPVTSQDAMVDKISAPSDAKSYSKAKAVLLTVLFPGAGHFYLGEKGRGEVFLGAEAVTWVGFAAFRTYGSWRKDDYIRFARDHAGIDPDGKDDDFYKWLTFYDSREDYNTTGRISNPGAPFYPNTREYYWQWDGETSREKYRDIKNASKTAYRKATFMIGMAIFNRVVAGIDIFRMFKKINAPSLTEFGDARKVKLDFDANPFGDNPRISMTVIHQF
jgi:hypothetical protein